MQLAAGYPVLCVRSAAFAWRVASLAANRCKTLAGKSVLFVALIRSKSRS